MVKGGTWRQASRADRTPATNGVTAHRATAKGRQGFTGDNSNSHSQALSRAAHWSGPGKTKSNRGGKGKRATSVLDSKLAASKEVFSRRIAFAPGRTEPWLQPGKLPEGAVVCNPGAAAKDAAKAAAAAAGGVDGAGPAIVDGITEPGRRLHHRERVRLKWEQSRPAGAGLRNVGNTCFLNSVLQCLTYTAPFYNTLNRSNHIAHCKKKGFCVMCELIRHMNTAMAHPRKVEVPKVIVLKLRAIARHFRPGRQEDAHEFMRYLVDGVHETLLRGHEKLDIHSKRTTAIYSIFGGYLKNTVSCTRCKHESVTFDATLDINLNIAKCATLMKALRKFTAPERLTKDNSYKCEGCKHKVNAIKRLTIHRAPAVLSIQLKRFDLMGGFGGKINKFVEYPEVLNLKPYMTGQLNHGHTYELNAVLVHAGYSVNSGHYYCFVKAPNKIWYRMDDSSVSTVKLSTVLQQQAYILIYTRRNGIVPTTAPAPPKLHTKPEPSNPTATAPRALTPATKLSSTPSRASSTTASTEVLGAVAAAAADSEDEKDERPEPATPTKPMGTEPLRDITSPVASSGLLDAQRLARRIASSTFFSHPGWRVDAKICDALRDRSSTPPMVTAPKVVARGVASDDDPDSASSMDKGPNTDDLDSDDMHSGSGDTDTDDAGKQSTNEGPPTTTQKSRPRKRAAPTVLDWDHAIGQRGKPTGSFSWDGKRRKTDDVLEYMQAGGALGHGVHSWGGDANVVDAVVPDKKVDPEEMEYERQRVADEEELDRGRVKKVKAKDGKSGAGPKDLSRHLQMAYSKKDTRDNDGGRGGRFGRGRNFGRGRGRGRGRGDQKGMGKKLTYKQFS